MLYAPNILAFIIGFCGIFVLIYRHLDSDWTGDCSWCYHWIQSSCGCTVLHSKVDNSIENKQNKLQDISYFVGMFFCLGKELISLKITATVILCFYFRLLPVILKIAEEYICFFICFRRQQRGKQSQKPEGYDDITAYRNQSVSAKDSNTLDLQLNYQQTSTMLRHKGNNPLPPPPQPNHNTYKLRGQPLPLPPPQQQNEPLNNPDVPPPPYPNDAVMASGGYGVGTGGGGGHYGSHYQASSNTSAASSALDHVYEVPH